MKRLSLFLFLAAPLAFASDAGAQGWGPTPQEEAKLIATLALAPGKMVAEIGAGDGQLTIKTAKAVSPGGKVFSTELGEAKRDTLKRNAAASGVTNIEVLEAGISATGLAAGCCDAVFLRDVYHHLTAPREILADLRKVLRPDGRLLIIDFEPRGGLPAVEGVPDNRRGHGIPIGVVVEELQAAGFEIVSRDETWRSDLYAVLARNPLVSRSRTEFSR